MSSGSLAALTGLMMVGLLLVVLRAGHRSRTAESEPDLPGQPAAHQQGEESTDNVVYDHTKRVRGATYEVHRALNRKAALAFLRERDVKRELYYVVVETPAGNIGRDMIMIFDERTGERIEFGIRRPLPAPQPSSTDCARCGYPILPGHVPPLPAGVGSVQIYATYEEELTSGGGYRCQECGNLSCAICVEPSPPPGKRRAPTCWCCSGEMTLHVE
jgi:hypothetical protein